MTKKAKKRIVILSAVAAALILLVFLILPFVISAVLYNSVFGQRFSTSDNYRYYLDDFDNLSAQRYEFLSYDNQKLVGYRYYVEGNSPKGVVVIAHGFGGGGHNSYMDVADFFAHNGYNVFAYDITGNDESEGDGVGGLPQGVKDLSCAIDFVKTTDEMKNLPIMLWGHSWGGYSVGAVLNFHPEVKAVAAFAGFNMSSDLIRAQGAQFAGSAINFLMPYVNSIESGKFGKYAKATAMDGFANTKAGVFVVHSTDDDVVPIKYGYDIYYEKYADDPRFEFVKYDDKGHTNIVYSQDAINYINDFTQKANEYFAGKDPSKEEIAEYYKNNLDRNVYSNMLDKELFGRIAKFYDAHL